MLRKHHAFGSKFVYIGRLNFLLAVAAQFRVTQVVCHDINDVGFFLVLCRLNCVCTAG